MEQNSAPGRQEASLVGSGGIQNGGGFDDQSFTFAAGAAVAGAGGVAIGGAGGVSVGDGISVAGDAGAVGGGGGSGVVGPSSESSIGKKRGNHRHSDQQINAMDTYYKDNQYPNKSQRNELAWRSGINLDQVQFWFQNQRTQEKIEMEQNSAPGHQEANLVGSGGIQNGGGYDDQGFSFAAGAAGASVAGAGGVAIGGAGGLSVGGGISVAGDAGAVGGGGGVAGPSSQSSIGKKRGNHRHSEQQINAMDAYYKDNRYPNKSQRNELAWRSRINPDQVQFWFQNQRTQEKRKSTREENEALRSELDVLTAQNPQYEEAIQLLDERNRLKFESVHIREATELRKSTLARFIAGENLQNLPIFQDPQNPTTSQNPQNLSSTFHNSQNLPMTIRNPQKLPINIPKSRNNTSAEFTKRPCNITYPQALPIISQNEQNFPIISEADDVNPYPADTGLAYTSTIITTSGEGINLISAVPTSEEYWGDI